MAEFKYQEPARLDLGKKIYQQSKGNVVSILSDAMTVLRQLGIAGLDIWIDLKGKDGERQFIRTKELTDCLKTQKEDMDTAWADIENLMQVLRCAKYYAKTQEKDDVV